MASNTSHAPVLTPILISGGSGTRLWPLSRDSRPKQFLKLTRGASLFQQTLLRSRNIGVHVRAPIIVCNAAHETLVLEQAAELGIHPAAVILEPAGRNTAPAVALAALIAMRTAGSAPDPLLLVMPADHIIDEEAAFAAAVRAAAAAAGNGRLVTFGVAPDRPETGFGYIRRGAAHGGWADIDRFVEKPDLETARAYVASGEYLWNSGIFLFSAAALLDELRTHAPAIVAACERTAASARTDGAVMRLGAEFASCPADSIDYAVMEKTAHGAVVPLAAGWSDLGSWSALYETLPHDSQGNATLGDVLLESCRNTFVSASSRLVAAVGLDDVIVVETEDAVLVLRRDRAQDVKKIVDALRVRRRTET